MILILIISVWEADDEAGQEEKRVCARHREAASQTEGGHRHHLKPHHHHCHQDLVIRSQAVLWLSLQRFGPTLVKLTRLTSSSGRDHDDRFDDGDCDNNGGGGG